MSKKHESLPTSKLVLWSRSGFTKAAKKKAVIFNIDVVSASQADIADWANMARQLVGGRIRLVHPNFEPFIDVARTDGSQFRIDEAFEAAWSTRSGEPAGSMPWILNTLRTDPTVRKTMLDHAPDGSGNFWVHVVPPPGQDWSMTDTQGLPLRITRVGVGIRTLTEELPLEVASVPYQDKVVTLATARRGTGDRVDLYIEEHEPFDKNNSSKQPEKPVATEVEPGTNSSATPTMRRNPSP